MLPPLSATPHDTVYISARTGDGIDRLLSALERLLREGKRRVVLHLPYSESSVLNALSGVAKVEDVSYEAEYIAVTATLDGKTAGRYQKFIVEETV